MKHVYSSGHHQFDTILQDATLAVLADLGISVPVIPFQDFLQYLAPPQPAFNFHDTMTSLKEGPDPTISSSGRWTTFLDDPKDSEEKEVVFNPISDIFTKVVAAVAANSSGAMKKKNSTVCFAQNPNRAPVSSERRAESRPDGYFVLKNDRGGPRTEKGGKTRWADIALPCEYKVKDGYDDRIDDVRKVIMSLQQIMRDDVCRRATFGMTIENTATRLWFCCRSMVLVSEAFNFIEEPEKLVKLFAAFAYADETSLGFDPTIEPVPGDNAKFVITVQRQNDLQSVRKFQTVRTISSYGAERLLGGGTRIFEAVELDENGKPTGPHVVLKDTWIDDDRVREGEVLSSLLEEANSEDKELVKQYFLTTVTHGDVWMGPENRDDTAKGLMRGLEIASDHNSNRIYRPKTHYRIVFKEICNPMDSISNLPDIFDVLTETVSALQLLRKLGWVHRDVSTGNILTYDGHAKLSDLEYAKKRRGSMRHEMRTGTVPFMSIEVAAQTFLFTPLPRVTIANLHQLASQDENPAQAGQTRIPFTHNHLHDLESLWWVAVWFLFYHRLSKEKEKSLVPSVTFRDAEQRINLAQNLFPPSGDLAKRMIVFQTETEFQERYYELPDDHKAFGARLNLIRDILLNQYRDVEARLPHSINPDSSSDQIYNDFKTIFSDIKSKYVGTKLEYLPKIHKELSKVEKAKRPRSESTNDAEGASALKSLKITTET